MADKLGIPFYVLNAEEDFEREVVRPFIATYAAGRTPNPCLNCNRKIRFGFLLNYATRTLGARYLATGHYARIRRGDDDLYQLWRGADRGKDQSYVLSVLGQADLAQALFPVGEYTKPQVRALAAERGLPTASRVESQDLCFVADGDYRRFLADHAPEAMRPGPILDTNGRQLGVHAGLPAYTIGQRGGLGIAAAQPLYVVALDTTRNALIVGTGAELGRSWLRAGRLTGSMAGRLPGRSKRKCKSATGQRLRRPLSSHWPMAMLRRSLARRCGISHRARERCSTRVSAASAAGRSARRAATRSAPYDP